MDLAFEAIYQPLSSIDMYFKKAHKAARSLFLGAQQPLCLRRSELYGLICAPSLQCLTHTTLNPAFALAKF